MTGNYLPKCDNTDTRLQELLQVVPAFKRISNDKAVMYETFICQQYRWLVKGAKPDTVAIDIGANIADSSIYLAQFEAVRKVYAYEPFYNLYKRGMNNIKASGLSDKIELYNCGISRSNTKIRIPRSLNANVYNKLKGYSGGEEVSVLSLGDVLSGKQNVIIKCDTEGSEYDIFNEHVDLDNVYKIQLEYHDGRKELVNIFNNNGFAVSDQPRDEKYGFINAWKQ